MLETIFIDSPFGKIGVAADGPFITGVFFNAGVLPENGLLGKNNAVLLEAAKQLDEYFNRRRREFLLPVFYEGTAFQKNVWAALRQIPYGKTCSYQDIARAVGNEKATRAVGMANNKNPLPILIPCHRVIGKNGRLVGYGGGLPIKEHLLELEKGDNI